MKNPINFIISICLILIFHNNSKAQGGSCNPAIENNVIIQCPVDSYKLVFFEDFNGTSIKTNRWQTFFPYGSNTLDTCKACRTKNGEAQNYYDDHVVVSNGICKLVSEFTGGAGNTVNGITKYFKSGMLYSKQFYNTYSKYEFRAKIAAGHGLFPAMWIFGWSTEMDIESFKTQEEIAFSTYKYGCLANGNTIPQQVKWYDYDANINKINYSQDFHLYAIEYTPYLVNFFIDNKLTASYPKYLINTTFPNNWYQPQPLNCSTTYNVLSVNPAFPKYGDHVNIIANFAMGAAGGDPFPLSPSEYPKNMEIDFIKVYQRNPQSEFTADCSKGIEGVNSICSNNNYIYSYNGGLAIDHWECSSNLAFTVLNSTQVSVHVINTTNLASTGFIKAVFAPSAFCDNINATKDISIGVPLINPSIDKSSFCETDIYPGVTNWNQIIFPVTIDNYTTTSYDNNPKLILGSSIYHKSFHFTITAINTCGTSSYISNNLSTLICTKKNGTPVQVRLKNNLDSTINTISISPNPSSNGWDISFNSIENANINSFLTDINGKTVWEYHNENFSGNELFIPKLEVVNGLYILHTTINNFTEVNKLIKE